MLDYRLRYFNYVLCLGYCGVHASCVSSFHRQCDHSVFPINEELCNIMEHVYSYYMFKIFLEGQKAPDFCCTFNLIHCTMEIFKFIGFIFL